jgi:hypothetical protein
LDFYYASRLFSGHAHVLANHCRYYDRFKPEGFCREAVCIPAIESVNANGEVDLQRFAELTEHTLVIDTDEKVIGLGQSSRARGDNLSSMRAPDFQLPDFKGKQHALSDYRGKKVLLAAYASW